MISFKSFISESGYNVPVVPIAHWNVDVKKDYTLVEINRNLAAELSQKFINPYAALMCVKKILTNYGIELPRVHLHQLEGEEVFAVQQFGQKSGVQTTTGVVDGKNITPPTHDADVEHYVYFGYALSEEGFFECYAEITDEKGIDSLLSGAEEIGIEGQLDPRQPK